MQSFAILCAVAGCAAAQPGQGVNFYSVDREIALGRQIAAGMAATLPVVHDPALEAYVAKLVAPLTAQVSSRFHYTFTLFDDRKPWWAPGFEFATPADGESEEPVAIAGGAIFVPLSGLRNAPTEAVFAFQLAHAVAHVALRHATRAATRTDLFQIGMQPLAALQPATGYAKVALSEGARLAQPVAELAFARRFELEADQAAAGFLAEAGFDPQPVIPYLEAKLEPHPLILAAHPSGSQRAAAVKAFMEKLPAREYTAATGEFAAMKAIASK